MGPLELLGRVAAVFERLGTPYATTGSIASIFYGEYRSTAGLGIVAIIRYGQVDDLIRAFPPPEFYISREGILDALRHGGMFNIIHVESALKADIIVSGSGVMDEGVLKRARRVEILPGVSAQLSSPEDLILNKLLFFRQGGSDKHLRDIAGMLKISGPQIDRASIDRLSEGMGVGEIWREVLAKVEGNRGPV